MKTDFKELARAKREEMARLRKIDKCYTNKQQYRKAGVFKLRHSVTRESRSINQPKNRFVIATPKNKRVSYRKCKIKWEVIQKPQEWKRISNSTIKKTRALNGSLKNQ